MKNITGILTFLVIGYSVAQTEVLTPYNEDLVKDLDGQFVFSENFDPISNAYTMRKIDENGTVTNFFDYTFSSATAQYSNVGATASNEFYNRRRPTYVKGNKAIARFVQGTTAVHLLYNGTSTSVFNLPNSSIVASLYSNFILNSDNAYIFDYSRIYETDYTTGNTSLIFTSPDPKSSDITSVECLKVMQNAGGLYWIDYYNFSKTLYKRVGGITTPILTVTGGDNLFMYQNKLNNEIYVTNFTSVNADKKLIKLDNAGNHTFLTTPPSAYLSAAYDLVNDKLLFYTLPGELISLDLTTNVVATVTVPTTGFEGLGFGKIVTNASGSLGYGVNPDGSPFFINGTSVTNLSGNLGTNDIDAGDFCGDNFYVQKEINQTTFLSEIALLTPSSNTDYLPNNVSNTSFYAGVSSNAGFYSTSQLGVSPYTASLFKSNCSNGLGIFDDDSEISSVAYPNPFTNEINIQISEAGNYSVSIIDMIGRVVLNEKFENTANMQLSAVSSLQPGKYLLKISNNQHTIIGNIVK